MLSLSDDSFDELASEVAFCLANIRHPACGLKDAGQFYENAAEAFRGHAILRLLIDGDNVGFLNDLVMSGQARRAYLRRCATTQYADFYLALGRSGSMLDAIAAGHLELAREIFRISPSTLRRGDEYESDFYYQRFLGLTLAGAPRADADDALQELARATDGEGARLAMCRVLHLRDASAMDETFLELLRERELENSEDASSADEEILVALGTKVFVEGVAVLKLARALGLPIQDQYPMCPTLALLPVDPPKPFDEFSQP